MKTKDKVTKEKFLLYEEIRKSGAVNMFDTVTVIAMSEGNLTKSDISYIMEHYKELAKKYL